MPTRPLLCLATLVLGCGAGIEPDVGPRPDVAIVLIDTLRRDHLDLYGYRTETAPFLRELAEQSAVFERAYSTSSWTAPATATVLTGLYPPRHGVVMGFNAYGKEAGGEDVAEDELSLTILPTGVPTLGELFSAAGYQTFGVASNVNVSPERGFARGFDRFERRRKDDAEALAETLVEWARERDPGRPALWYVHLNDVHRPYDPRAPWYVEAGPGIAEARARYDSEIRYVDEVLRELWADLGWDESTVVCVLADHGEEFQDHGGTGHRFQLYGELMNVALLLRAPGFTDLGMRVTEPVSLIDVLPTLAALCGLDDDAERDGRSLLPLLDGAPTADRPLFAHRRWPRSERAVWAVVDGPWKLIVDETKGTAQLFDAVTDPLDQADLAAERPEVVEALRARLAPLRAAAPLEETLTTIEVDAALDRHLREMGYAGGEDER